MAIMSKLTDFVRSMTSEKANTDIPPGTEVPDNDHDAVPMPERAPQAGFEPEREE